MGKRPAPTDLQIFHVSSGVYHMLVRGKHALAKSRGFAKKADTGIPALREALLATTWDIRERNAHAFNEDAESSLKRLKLWVADTTADYKLTQDQRERVEQRIKQKVEGLGDVSPIH